MSTLDRFLNAISPERYRRNTRSTTREEDLEELQFPNRSRRTRVRGESSSPIPSPTSSISSHPEVEAIPIPEIVSIQQPQQVNNLPPPPPLLLPMAFLANNPSPLFFQAYNVMPKNPEHFCSKFHANDPNRTAEEHLRIFQTCLKDRGIVHEDVACRLFPYSLGEEAFYWYNHLPASSILNWNDLEKAFLQKFRIPISANELYLQFIKVKREVNEPIASFNNRFHRAFTRLQDPYVLDDGTALGVYYEALDSLTATFLKWRPNPPGTLSDAYTEAVQLSTDLRQHLTGPLPSLGPVAHPNQIQAVN